MMYPLTVIFVTAAAAAGFIRLALLWANNRLTIAMGSDLAVKAYRNTLYQPYVFHTGSNSSTLISAILNKVNSVIYQTFAPSLTLISSLMLLLTIIAALLAIDAEVARPDGRCCDRRNVPSHHAIVAQDTHTQRAGSSPSLQPNLEGTTGRVWWHT